MFKMRSEKNNLRVIFILIGINFVTTNILPVGKLKLFCES